MTASVRDVSRIVAGFLGAPLVSGVLFGLMWLNPFAGFFALVFAYPFAWGLGIPAYFIARKKGWLKFWQVSLAGAVLGLIAGVILVLSDPPGTWSVSDLILPGLFIVNGTAVAMMFWFITIKPRLSQDVRQG